MSFCPPIVGPTFSSGFSIRPGSAKKENVNQLFVRVSFDLDAIVSTFQMTLEKVQMLQNDSPLSRKIMTQNAQVDLT